MSLTRPTPWRSLATSLTSSIRATKCHPSSSTSQAYTLSASALSETTSSRRPSPQSFPSSRQQRQQPQPQPRSHRHRHHQALSFTSSSSSPSSESPPPPRPISTAIPRVPAPTPFVPDVATFLRLIGRDLAQHAAKIPDWHALFSLSSAQLRGLGVAPARSRRYLLRWRDNFRRGRYGPGGHLRHVDAAGVAELRIVEAPVTRRGGGGGSSSSNGDDDNRSGGSFATTSLGPGRRKIIVNLPPGAAGPDAAPAAAGAAARAAADQLLVPVKGYKILGGRSIWGKRIRLVKGSDEKVARVVAEEGMWEDRRGRKSNGGERRRAEVLAKKRAEERKARV